MDEKTVSALLPGIAETIGLDSSRQAEDIKITAAKGGSPPLTLEQQVLQLNSTVARLTRELESIKATLKEGKRDIESLWVNSDLHFDNAKNLANALKARLQPHSKGPKTEDRITRLKSRLKVSSNLWIGKADLGRFFQMTRSAFHWFYLTLKASGEFETMKKAGRVYIRLAKTAP